MNELTFLQQNVWIPSSSESLGRVKVIHGANDEIFDCLVGHRVATVQQSLVDAFNIPDLALPFVNGEQVGKDYRLQPNETLEFVLQRGEKDGNAYGRDRRKCDPHDFYPTPPQATWALLEREDFGRTVWEPACGDGAISEVLKQAGYRVRSTDLVDRGYGKVADFLSTSKTVESIVTNPPYALAEEFVKKALQSTTYKVAMFLRLSFLESQRRYDLFQRTPLEAVYIFSRRLSLHRNGIDSGNSGVVAYAWFVWRHGYRGEPRLRWFDPK